MVNKQTALFLCLVSYAYASEEIQLFKSEITVHTDATITVQETIQVRSLGYSIKRGIVREFPTHYKDQWGNNFTIAFHVNKVLRDGHPEPYQSESVANGKKIYIGSKDVLLMPGIYTYTISYTTNRQLGFFERYDELYWNVTGTGWRLPINRVIAIVHLPKEIKRTDVTLEGYTGRQSSKERNYKGWITESGDIVIESLYPLEMFEGLTLVITWPKGYIQQPWWWQEWWWFFSDNSHIALGILGIVLLLCWYFFCWKRFRLSQRIGTIIPLFYPPTAMTPGGMRYFNRMVYDAKVLAADIVFMAVNGWLTIECATQFATLYTLHKKKTPLNDQKHYIKLMDVLFGNHNIVTLTQKNSTRVGAAIAYEKSAYDTLYERYFQRPIEYASGAFVISFFSCVAVGLVIDELTTYVLIVTICCHVALNVGFLYMLQGYTSQGLDYKKNIEGFKMFLVTTEQERLKIIGTPPTKTPELYEQYLPYAIALGVESQWSQQFAPLFEEMRQQGTPYVSAWIVGTDFNAFTASSFADTMSNNINSAIASSTTIPGTSSGSGGRGSSGGGGGGGGGGGW